MKKVRGGSLFWEILLQMKTIQSPFILNLSKIVFSSRNTMGKNREHFTILVWKWLHYFY